MKFLFTYLILVLIYFSNLIYAQQIKIDVCGQVLLNFSETDTKYNFTQGGEIDKSTESIYKTDFGNFNSIGLNAEIVFSNNYLSGLEISYGKKNTWNISLPDNFYSNTNVTLLTIAAPLLYKYNFAENYFVLLGTSIGYEKSNYTEKYNIRNTNSGIIEDRQDEKSLSSLRLKPQMRFSTSVLFPFEPELFFSYDLTSKFKFENFRLDYLGSVEYNFNNISFGLTLNYVFNY